jgi:hypothetical protein
MNRLVAIATLGMVGLLLAGAAATAAAQQAAAPSSAPADPAAASDAAPLQQVTIEKRILEQKARSFVMNVTGASGFYLDAPVQLWRRPICPMVAGLPPEAGQHVFDHLDDVLASVGVPRGKVGCHPNFFFIVTAEPESVLNGAWKHRWNLFGDASPTLVERFIRTPRPVRVWYNTILSGRDTAATTAGSVPGLSSDTTLNGSTFGELPSVEDDGNGVRARFMALTDLLAVIAIVDPTKVQGFNWDQVVDYVTMAGLTRVAPDVDLGDTPSILRLFSVDSASRPAGLSEWDRTFLKELYDTDPTLRGQRFEVSHLMVRDLQSANP